VKTRATAARTSGAGISPRTAWRGCGLLHRDTNAAHCYRAARCASRTTAAGLCPGTLPHALRGVASTTSTSTAYAGAGRLLLAVTWHSRTPPRGYTGARAPRYFASATAARGLRLPLCHPFSRPARPTFACAARSVSVPTAPPRQLPHAAFRDGQFPLPHTLARTTLLPRPPRLPPPHAAPPTAPTTCLLGRLVPTPHDLPQDYIPGFSTLYDLATRLCGNGVSAITFCKHRRHHCLLPAASPCCAAFLFAFCTHYCTLSYHLPLPRFHL